MVGPQLGASLVEEGDALLDALQGPDDVPFEPDKHRHRVLVGAAPDLSCIQLRLGDDPSALVLGRLGQAALVDEEGCLLLGAGDDPVRLVLRLDDDPLTFRVDPLRGADLLRDCDAELVDEAQRVVLVQDDAVRERQLLSARDERLEPLDEEDDVDRRALQAFGPDGLSHAA